MANTPIHVNIATDPVAGHGWHTSFGIVPLAIYPSEEKTVEQAWTPGVSTHKIAARVLHKGVGIVQQGHDCGAYIADLAPPAIGLGNAFLPIIMLKSSRKVMFGASTVVVEGTPAGGAEQGRVSLPMLTCSDPVPLPTVFPTKNAENTVLIGMTEADISYGWADIWAAMAIEGIALIAGHKGPEGLVDVLGGLIGWDPIKTGLSAVFGLAASIARSAESGFQEPIVLKVDTGGGVAHQGVEVKWNPSTGEKQVSVEYGAAQGKGSVGAKQGPDGAWQVTGVPDLFGDGATKKP